MRLRQLLVAASSCSLCHGAMLYFGFVHARAHGIAHARAHRCLHAWRQVEAISRFWAPPAVDDIRLLPVAAIGLIMNVVGLIFFHQQHHPASGCAGCEHTGMEGRGENMQAVFLHVLADAMGSVGALLAAALSRFLGWHLADPICSIFVALIIGISV